MSIDSLRLKQLTAFEDLLNCEQVFTFYWNTGENPPSNGKNGGILDLIKYV